jgi:hypothetical protein
VQNVRRAAEMYFYGAAYFLLVGWQTKRGLFADKIMFPFKVFPRFYLEIYARSHFILFRKRIKVNQEDQKVQVTVAVMISCRETSELTAERICKILHQDLAGYGTIPFWAISTRVGQMKEKHFLC